MKNQNQKSEEKQSLLFNKKKYLILIFSIFLLFIGFLLLSGGELVTQHLTQNFFLVEELLLRQL